MNALQGNLPSTPPIVLSIAGFDPSSGAGITADLKTFAAHGCYGISCVTALTVQSTQGVRQVSPVDAALVAATLACLAEDTPTAGIKIGMLGTAAVARAVADYLESCVTPLSAIVLDPVLRSSSGADLLDAEGLQIIRRHLLATVGWVTPNVSELAVLLGEPVADADDVPAQARRLQVMAEQAGNPHLRVVVTGGHLAEPHDYFLGCEQDRQEEDQQEDVRRSVGAAESTGGPLPSAEGARGTWIRGQRIETSATHGTGCAFSSSLTCQLVSGYNGSEAVERAKGYVAAAMQCAYVMGRRNGPLNHLFAFDPR